jgi:hypothetical protein
MLGWDAKYESVSISILLKGGFGASGGVGYSLPTWSDRASRCRYDEAHTGHLSTCRGIPFMCIDNTAVATIDHPSTLASQNNLALLARDKGELS